MHNYTPAVTPTGEENPQKSVAPAPRRGYNITQPTSWTCGARVPDTRGRTRVRCGAVNDINDRRCSQCGAPNNQENTGDTHMATNKPSTDKSKTENKSADSKNGGAARPAAQAAPATAATAQPDKPSAPIVAAAPAAGAATSAASDAAKPADKSKPDPSDPKSYKGLPRLRFYSTTPGKEEYCVRILPIFLDKYGAPRDPDGNIMALRPKQAREMGGDGVPAKVKKIEAKEAREKLLAGMTDAEKLAFVAKEREERKAAKEQKKAAQKAALMAELRKELESQGIKLPTA